MSPMSEKDQEYLRQSLGENVQALPTEEVVYGVHELGFVVFAPRSEAERFSRLCRVFNECATWGEIRSILLPEEVAELESQSGVADDEYSRPAPLDDEAFVPTNVSGWENSTWPRFPASTMFDWFPLELAIEYATVAPQYDDCWLLIEPKNADVVAARLGALGVHCVRDDALVRTMWFHR